MPGTTLGTAHINSPAAHKCMNWVLLSVSPIYGRKTSNITIQRSDKNTETGNLDTRKTYTLKRKTGQRWKKAGFSQIHGSYQN